MSAQIGFALFLFCIGCGLGAWTGLMIETVLWAYRQAGVTGACGVVGGLIGLAAAVWDAHRRNDP